MLAVWREISVGAKYSRVKFSWIAQPLFKTTPPVLENECFNYSWIGAEPRKTRKLNPTEISLHTLYY